MLRSGFRTDRTHGRRRKVRYVQRFRAPVVVLAITLLALICGGCFDAYSPYRGPTSAATFPCAEGDYLCTETRITQQEIANTEGYFCGDQRDDGLRRAGGSERSCEDLCETTHENDREVRDCDRECQADRDDSDTRERQFYRYCMEQP